MVIFVHSPPSTSCSYHECMQEGCPSPSFSLFSIDEPSFNHGPDVQLLF